MIYAKKEADIKNNRILYVEAPFDKALEAIESKGGKIITAKQLADARMQYDADNSLSTNGSYIKEGNLFVPNNKHKRILLRNSLVLKNPTEATEAHRNGKEYAIPGTVDSILGKLKEGKDYIVLDSLDAVPTDRFGEDERMKFLFGESAQDYGLWLKDKGNVSKTGFYNFRDDSYIDKQEGLFAGQLWLRGLGDGSDIDGYGRFLDSNCRVCGVQRIGGADALKKSVVETYTPRQVQNIVNKTLQHVGITGGVKKTIISDLEKRLK